MSDYECSRLGRHEMQLVKTYRCQNCGWICDEHPVPIWVFGCFGSFLFGGLLVAMWLT